uniref:Uncharacterized protein n=1 Tax=Tanacetum cinerariifolium TaxID=118510 RepID=A0A699RGR4_TANCI|nr:hypothetical protein [Tanacetum cinerariifolium]
MNTACDQVEFRRISLTGFRSCASHSQTGASQSRQSTDEIILDDLLALDSRVRFDLGDWRLEQTATFSISTNSE